MFLIYDYLYTNNYSTPGLLKGDQFKQVINSHTESGVARCYCTTEGGTESQSWVVAIGVSSKQRRLSI